jgi:hypothetical protein
LFDGDGQVLAGEKLVIRDEAVIAAARTAFNMRNGRLSRMD